MHISPNLYHMQII